MLGWRCYLVEELRLSRAGGDGRFVSCSLGAHFNTVRSALALSLFPAAPFVRLDQLLICAEVSGEGVDSATTTYPMVKVERDTVCYYTWSRPRACVTPPFACASYSPPPHPSHPPGALQAVDEAGMPPPPIIEI